MRDDAAKTARRSALGRQCPALPADVGDWTACQSAVESAAEQLGGLGPAGFWFVALRPVYLSMTRVNL